MTAAFAFLWLVCSSAWAQGLQKVKYATGTEGIRTSLTLCRNDDVTCEVTEFSSMRTLDISVVSLWTISSNVENASFITKSSFYLEIFHFVLHCFVLCFV